MLNLTVALAALSISFSGPSIASYKDVRFGRAKMDVSAPNLTNTYEELFQSKVDPLSSEEILKLRKYKVLLVPGFLSNVGTDLRQEFEKLLPWVFDGKDDQVEWLKTQGFQVDRVHLETEATPEANAPLIRDAVLNADLPVILISHSKGGLDILEAILGEPKLKEHIGGWIAVQPPFFGTPVADVWSADPRFLEFVDKVFKRLGGSAGSLVSLKMEERMPYMEKYAVEIGEILKAIPTITFGGYIPDVKGRWDSVFEPYFRDQLEAAGIESDGVVPWRNTVIPGNPFVLGKGVDHLMPIGSMNLRPYNRVRFLQTMLKLLVERQNL